MTDHRLVSTFVNSITNFKLALLLLAGLILLAACSRLEKPGSVPISKVRTVTNNQEKFGEPFGIAARDGEIFVADGETGKIWRVSDNQNFTVVTDRLHTPSQIAFDKNGDLIVADSGTHTIKRIKITTGAVELIAGVENQKGDADGEANQALFNAPIGVAILEDKIFVADTYNDKIRVVENGRVSTVAGGEQGYADGVANEARFDTPCGLAIWKNRLIVADTGNRRLRAVETSGATRTLAGSGAEQSRDGMPGEASFIEPLAVAVDRFGVIYVADGNSIRAVGRRLFPFVETVAGAKRGFDDGDLQTARFNRLSGLANDETGDLFVTDAENQTIRVLTGAAAIGAEISNEAKEKMRVSAEEFRRMGEPRWTYDPPNQTREIAGTLGEIRGEIVNDNSRVWFHNGLDVAGAYGETARFVRTEKVLHPLAVENFATSRELIRMPTIGYIHIRMGRDQVDKIFDDQRFQFERDEFGKLKNVRVPRGARFEAGEAVGTLNSLNHVHLIAGRAGAEMNALAALELPGVSDRIAPVIEQVKIYDENWQPLDETQNQNARIKLAGKTRIVARAYDRMDGNAERRRLGVYRVGYQILRHDETPLSEVNWTISFDRNPDAEAVKFAYATGSKSGATGETVFNYIASNLVSGDFFREDFFDASALETGDYILRVSAADFFGNTTSEDINFVR